MIDEDAVMADNSSASRDDDDFDLSKRVYVCNFAHILLKATSTGKTTKSKKQHPTASISVSSLFPFTSPPSILLAASLVSLIQSHNKQTQTLSRHIHCYRATKDILLREWECAFWSFGFPWSTNATAALNILQSSSSARTLFLGGCTVKKDFHGKSGTFITHLTNPDLKLAREQQERKKRRERVDRKDQDEAIKPVS